MQRLTWSPEESGFNQSETCACHVNLAAEKHWQFMPNWTYGRTVEFIFFVFNMLFLPKYRVIYYDYIVEWCSGI